MSNDDAKEDCSDIDELTDQEAKLLDACKRGHKAVVIQLLLNRHLNLNARDNVRLWRSRTWLTPDILQKLQTPLIRAAKYGKFPIVRLLCERPGRSIDLEAVDQVRFLMM